MTSKNLDPMQDPEFPKVVETSLHTKPDRHKPIGKRKPVKIVAKGRGTADSFLDAWLIAACRKAGLEHFCDNLGGLSALGRGGVDSDTTHFVIEYSPRFDQIKEAFGMESLNQGGCDGTASQGDGVGLNVSLSGSRGCLIRRLLPTILIFSQVHSCRLRGGVS
jgi:hypothetical protein